MKPSEGLKVLLVLHRGAKRPVSYRGRGDICPFDSLIGEKGLLI